MCRVEDGLVRMVCSYANQDQHCCSTGEQNVEPRGVCSVGGCVVCECVWVNVCAWMCCVVCVRGLMCKYVCVCVYPWFNTSVISD